MGRTGAALTIGTATSVAVTAPMVLVLEVLVPVLDLGGMGMASIPLGVALAVGVLVLPAVGWAWVVATVAGEHVRHVVRATVPAALGTAVVAGLSVDLSQLLIGTVRPWHRLGVHALFATAFALGLAAFIGVVTRRAVGAVGPVGTDARRRGRAAAAATAAGVVVGAGFAVPLDWVVLPGMGMDMLLPLYLVLATGSFPGGAVLGSSLRSARAPVDEPVRTPARPAT